VIGLVANPLRIYAYKDLTQAGLMGLDGAANTVNLLPAAGADPQALRRSLLSIRGIASAERVAAAGEALNRTIGGYTDVLRVVQVVAFGLALLIAFNSAGIALDERAREHATMFAFGLPVRTVLRGVVVEGALAGALATLLGVAGGLAIIRYIVGITTPRVMPELGVAAVIEPGTLAVAVALGIAAAAVVPLLLARRLGRMDIPGMLRVVE
jgi:putative ABC transport system permease protein